MTFMLVTLILVVGCNIGLWMARRTLTGGAGDVAITAVPIPEHIEKQRKQGPPFYCGTAFCGHDTLKAAADCWQRHCARVKETTAHFNSLLAEGKTKEAYAYKRDADQILYPHLNSANWPINRPMEVLRAEYMERAKAELKQR